MATRLWSVVFDANDHEALASFWAETLRWHMNRHEEYSSVTHGEGLLPRLEFVPAPESKSSKNRIHFDLAAESKEERDSIVARLLGLGARHVDIGQPVDAEHVVLADPEGNEFCICPGARRFVGNFPIYAVAYDALDGPTLGRFWSVATAWPIVREVGHFVALQSPNGIGPIITVSGPPERVADKPVKNRVHLDVAPFSQDNQASEVERLVGLGARRIDIGQGDVPWVVMADPEGNDDACPSERRRMRRYAGIACPVLPRHSQRSRRTFVAMKLKR